MYIIRADHSAIFDADDFAQYSIAHKPDAAVLMAGTRTGTVVSLARYHDSEEAQQAMAALFTSLSTGEPAFTMPDTRWHAEEMPVHDARTKRRGGS